MDTEIFEELGLTRGEIKIYLALLNLGSSTAGPIIEKSGLQNSVVHLALNSLIKKGLISTTKEGKKNRYQASNPKHFLEFINEKKERFEKILPELLITQNASSEKLETIIFRGIRGVKELLYELLEAKGKEHYTINSSKKSLILGDDWWINYHKKRVSKNIKAKLIFNKSLKNWIKENAYQKAEFRFTEEGFEPLTETIIRGNKIGIIIWADEPTGILISQTEVANSYNKYFDIIWKQAKS